MTGSGKAGLKIAEAVRNQIEISWLSLDELLAQDHRARDVWAYVAGLDLSAFYDAVKVEAGRRGRAAIDPAILMALWLYATLDNVGSARALERLCETDLVYRWLRGGVGVNYHTLADFRTSAGAFLDDLLTSSMTALVKAGVLDVSTLAVDGVKVRANAGSRSFRRDATLGELHAQASLKVAALREELANDPGASAARAARRTLQTSAQRLARIEKAREAAAEVTAQKLASAKAARRKTPRNTRPARASTTDPDARVMHMADGGWRPAYNIQFKTDPKLCLVIGVETSNGGADRNQLAPAVAEIERRFGQTPSTVLADGGYVSHDPINALHDRGVALYCPLPKAAPDKAAPQNILPPEAAAKTPESPGAGAADMADKQNIKRKQRARDKEGAGVTAWKARMQDEASLAIYARRFACERPHADMRNRGLQQLGVRGLKKVHACILWFVHAYNFLSLRRLTLNPAAC